MINKIQKFITHFLLIAIFTVCSSLNALAQATPSNNADFVSIQNLFSSLTVDLPESDVICRAGGSLGELFSKTVKVKTAGNVFFIDKTSKEIGQVERAEVTNYDNSESKIYMFVKAFDLKEQDFIDLVIKKNLVVTNNTDIVFIIKTKKSDGNEETYIYDGKNLNGEKVSSTVYTKMTKLKVKEYNGSKFFVANGYVKIRFPVPPKKLEENGSFNTPFNSQIGSLTCYFEGMPVHDYDLADLNDAFDGGLVNDITEEALNNSRERKP